MVDALKIFVTFVFFLVEIFVKPGGNCQHDSGIVKTCTRAILQVIFCFYDFSTHTLSNSLDSLVFLFFVFITSLLGRYTSSRILTARCPVTVCESTDVHLMFHLDDTAPAKANILNQNYQLHINDDQMADFTLTI